MPEKQGVRTYVLLVVAMALVIAIVTGMCLLLIRHRLLAQVTDDLSQDLNHSVITFENLQAERVGALDRENSLLAELPTLKALMTSGDDLTIQDGAIEFWQLSGNDLFALVDLNGRVVAVYTKGATPDADLRQGLKTLLASPDKHYLIDRQGLYICSLRPLYFGNDKDGTLLGYVISGVSTERTVRQISQPTGVEATFLSGGRVVASTLSPSGQAGLATQPRLLSGTPQAPSTVKFAGTRFLAATEDLSAVATSSLQLVVLKSFEPAEHSINRIDRMVLSAGLLALLSGTILMITLSRLVTRPLEELSQSVIAFGVGDGKYRIPRYGTQEVRQLSTAFAGMRKEIQQANRALLESERLATIGRMASSVSHDLRHYLAAIYANSEFLASHRLSEKERAEIFIDIRSAVHGTTDMIESLLIFSRTGGASMRRAPELMATLLERAMTLVRAHPDAEGVSLITHYGNPVETAAVVDGKQIERAICNLLLNACQAARDTGRPAKVSLTLDTREKDMIVSVVDNGNGVPGNIRNNLLEPFVSEGKQKGTGLGLTLAHCIAVEHGGEVVLFSSHPGETIFQMKIARELQPWDAPVLAEADSHDKVIAHENLQ
ncbi:ATP-binding protein [Acidicapsa ligni]|uniref:ATP-binding protein n=1 Tax=Acidicapsa ligni TaxID=542300 RepID=UPI0021E0B506|nr:ATP-binding protein [Acidicapsa ligni]